MQVRQPLGDFEGSNTSRDGVVADHDYLVARENLLQQRRNFLGLCRRWDDRIVSKQDHVDHGARRAGLTHGHCVRAGVGPADQPAGSASLLSRPRSPSRCESA